MSAGWLTIRGARQHNLKDITVSLPRNALTVVTGPSGSGKSSLVFDTLYAEGQRRYVESLSTYAKQFLERMPKPDVDAIAGISPAVAIEQRNPTTSSRSTVGTATEIYDYLRLLWARVGEPRCVRCGGAVRRDTPQSAADAVIEAAAGATVMITFPVPPGAERRHLADGLRAMGFVRVVADGETVRIDDLDDKAREARSLLVVVDRITATSSATGRLADAVATAFAEGEGIAIAVTPSASLRFSDRDACADCGHAAPALRPSLFSFNNPYGACPGCKGFGAVLEYDESLIVPNPERSLGDGALDPWTKPRYEGRRRLLREVAKAKRIPFDRPWDTLTPSQRRLLLHGRSGRFVGMLPFLRALERKRYKQYIRVFLRQYQLARPCPACGGKRLKPEALAVMVAGRSIADVSSLTADALSAWLDGLSLPPLARTVAQLLLDELTSRVAYLRDVGLGYLTLDRQTRTLSGGEAQRIALANALGSRLVETLYVLDEPSIGLHPRDIDRLLGLLRALADRGNTVVVVEHDPATIRTADYLVELGPGSGERGGEVAFAGPAPGLRDTSTLTAQYLRGEKRIAVPTGRRRAGPSWLSIQGATLHNLRGLDAAIPLAAMTAVTGVSGSGKSTFVHDVVYRQLELRLRGGHSAKQHLGEEIGSIQALTGWEALTDVVLVDQSPIGRSPRSNPVTYLKAFDDLRALFARQPLAVARGYTPSTFSFNVPGGRCDACEGAGHVQIEMIFLADVFVPCEACRATRFRPEVLDVRVDGLSIHDVLTLTASEAMLRFRREERFVRLLWHLQQVGLGYLRLGQSATTLSGGEAQRLKIARELARVGGRGGRRLYLLDEPTTGLHLDDVRVLGRVLDRLVDQGHTVVMIEHHLDLIKRADWVIELGPEGGDDGGRLVVAGTPEDVAAHPTSHTGRYLRPLLTSAALSHAS